VHSPLFVVRLATAGWAVLFYLSKALVPRHLTFIYPRWQIDPWNASSYLGILIVCAAFCVLWRYRHRGAKPYLADFGFFLLNLVPVLGIVDIFFFRYSFVADHWQYVSLAGITTLFVWCVWKVCGGLSRREYLPRVAATTAIAVCIVLSWQQQEIY